MKASSVYAIQRQMQPPWRRSSLSPSLLSAIVRPVQSHTISCRRPFTSKEPPSASSSKTSENITKKNERVDNKSTKKDKDLSSRLKQPSRKYWNKTKTSPDASSRTIRDASGTSKLQVPVLSPSEYYYRIKTKDGDSVHIALPNLNASSLLDPAKYCRYSANPSQAGSAAMTHGVSRSISGTDAARRLLRGKKEFVDTVRSQLVLDQPVSSKQRQSSSSHAGNKHKQRKSHAAILVDHGIPPQLLQHCIDMTDALLNHYGNASECSFHNYYQQRASFQYNKHTPSTGSTAPRVPLPQVLRVRSRNSTNRCTVWPPSSSLEDGNNESAAEWNHNMSLYLTVMERLASKLHIVLKRTKHREESSSSHQHLPGPDAKDEEDDSEEDVTASPLLFGNSSSPHWNVDMLRESYYDVRHNHNEGKSSSTNPSDPLLIVEWEQALPSSPIIGHVLLRLQGQASKQNPLLNSSNTSSSPRKSASQQVTMVFDSCFRQEII